MGREVRMVPADWQHPKNSSGNYIPLHEGDYGGGYVQAAADWDAEYAKWQEGFVRDYGAGKDWRPRQPDDGDTFTQWTGPRPSPADYMPNWPASERTNYMMYEDTSEGTPISPAFPTPEELARWLADTGASSFGNMTATYEQWLSVARGRFAPSMVIEGGKMMSGVEFAASADTHPKDGDVKQTPLVSGAVAATSGETPNPGPSS